MGHAALAFGKRVGEFLFHQGCLHQLGFGGAESIQEGAHRFVLGLAFGLSDQLLFLVSAWQCDVPAGDVLAKSSQ